MPDDISRYVVGSGEFDDAAGDWVGRCDVGVGSVGILRVEVKNVGVDGESEVTLKVAQPENIEAVAEIVDASAATGGEVTDDLRTTRSHHRTENRDEGQVVRIAHQPLAHEACDFGYARLREGEVGRVVDEPSRAFAADEPKIGESLEVHACR